MEQFPLKKLKVEFRITDLINASYYDLPEDFCFAGESHDFWELSYVDRGAVIFRINGSSYLVKAGEMMFCKPNTFHGCQVWPGQPAAEIDIAFHVEGPVMEILENQIVILSAEEKQCIATIVREAAQTYTHFDNQPAAVRLEKTENAPYGSEQIIRNRLEELMIYACRSGTNIRRETRLIRASSESRNLSLAERVYAYMQEHYSSRLTLDSLARTHSVSVTQLKRAFREEFGSPVITCLTELRIREAKRLVKEGKLNFSQIAEAVGYSSIHYFSAVFKKHTGKTLTQYARSMLK